jgi:ribose transport system substrate-binding protein
MRRALVCGLVIPALVLGVSACSSSSSSGTSGGTTTSAATQGGGAASSAAASAATSAAASAATDTGLAAAQAVVAQYAAETHDVGVSIPLTSKPKTGVKFAFLQCELESCTYLAKAMKQATDALGWQLINIASKSATPGPAFQQAIDSGAQYIASTGEAPALYKEQAMAAKAKGIKILSCYDTTVPDPAQSNIYSQCGDTTFVEKTGPLMADWAIADSKGAAHILSVSIPSFPVLKSETDAFAAEAKKNCSGCSVTDLNVSINDLVGGKTPALVANAVQADPKINYVFNSFGSLPAGETAALKSAGLLDRVKVYGQDFSGFDLDEIVKGTQHAWSADPKSLAAWLMVDYAARLSEGMPLTEERKAAALPTYLVQTADQATAVIKVGGDWNPVGMADTFKKLWQVG